MKIKIDYDCTSVDIIDIANTALESRGLVFVAAEVHNDIYELVEFEP